MKNILVCTIATLALAGPGRAQDLAKDGTNITLDCHAKPGSGNARGGLVAIIAGGAAGQRVRATPPGTPASRMSLSRSATTSGLSRLSVPRQPSSPSGVL